MMVETYNRDGCVVEDGEFVRTSDYERLMKRAIDYLMMDTRWAIWTEAEIREELENE